jgi:hypothetical protein
MKENQMNHQSLTVLLNQAAISGKLDLGGLQLSTLPAKVFELNNLQWLYLDNNCFATLPAELAQLTHLKVLSLANNQLTTLPPEFAQLQNLEMLYLANNQLKTLPPEITDLKNLKVLSLTNNQLTELPKRLLLLPQLKVLALANNPLTSLPPELVVQGTQAIFTYLRKSQPGRKQWRANLLLVGEAGVGKTSLLRALRGEPFKVQEEAMPSTAMSTWLLKPPNQTKVTLHLKTWDFGSPVSYHLAHQLGLTPRSVVLLVWNAGGGYEVGKLYYWLNLIQARSPHVIVLLVATHSDEGEVIVLPLVDLKRKYPQIIGSYQVSNKTGAGIEMLKQVIAEEVAKLPFMGETWPSHWLAATNVIRNTASPYLTLQQLQAVLTSNKLTPKESVILLNWLHRLGDLLFFPKESPLHSLIMLKPHWVIEQIGRVLTSPVVMANKGILTSAQINELWEDVEPSGREYCLNLMEKLDLSYRTLENRQTSFVGECLPLDPPDHFKSWQTMTKAKELRMTYQLHTLPPGIPTEFIARSHRFSTNTQWRYGALLADRHHLGLIQALPEERQLILAVRGPYPHNFFTVLRDGLELTLQRQPGLQIKRQIPCVGHHGQSCAYEFDYAMLIRAMDQQVEEVQCQVRFDYVLVEELLYGLDWRTLEMVLQKMEDLTAETGKDVKEHLRNLTELSQRQLFQCLTQQQLQQDWRCPYLFTLHSPSPVGEWWRKLFTVKEVQLQLYCQGFDSYAPHPAAKGGNYTISEFRNWIPLLPVAILIVSVIATTLIGTSLSDRPVKEAERKLLKKLMEELSLTIDETTLPSLYLLLKELDPLEHWGGLEQVVTPEGQVLWLCQRHAQAYRQQNG